MMQNLSAKHKSDSVAEVQGGKDAVQHPSDHRKNASNNAEEQGRNDLMEQAWMGQISENHQDVLVGMKERIKRMSLETMKEYLSKRSWDEARGKEADEPQMSAVSKFRQILADVIDETKIEDDLCSLVFSLSEGEQLRHLRSSWLGNDDNPAMEQAKQMWAQELYADLLKQGTGNRDDNQEVVGPVDYLEAGALQAEQEPLPEENGDRSARAMLRTKLLQALREVESSTFQAINDGTSTASQETPKLPQLADKYKELHPSNMHIGIEDMMQNSTNLCLHRQTTGQAAIDRAYALMARQFLKFGAPTSLRPALWRVALGLQAKNTVAEIGAFKAILHEAKLQPIPAVDNALKEDMDTICNDVTYFCFEEKIRKTLSAFSRDEWVRENAPFAYCDLIEKQLDGEGLLPCDNFPPCGVLPLSGIAKFAAPLALIYEKENEMHAVFRQMYARFWCRLGCLSSLPGTIAHLCQTFEELLVAQGYSVFAHCLKLGLHPLNLAFPWLCSAFEEYLDAEQILLLWDRILGYNDLYILPVLAAAIFMFRSRQITEASDASEVEDIMKDGSKLKAIPLLQAFLFPEAFR